MGYRIFFNTNILPEGAEDPFIEVSRADSPYASFYLAVRIPENHPLGEVTDIVQRDIVPQLTSVPNVQRVENSGVKPAMRIWLNAWKMAALDVTAHDVRETLQRYRSTSRTPHYGIPEHQ